LGETVGARCARPFGHGGTRAQGHKGTRARGGGNKTIIEYETDNYFSSAIFISGAAQAQEPAKLTPIVHLFANAEFNPTPEVAKDYSFWIGRTLFGFNYQYDKKWSARILIDRTRLTGSMNTMYVKVANLRWTPDDRFAVEMGAVNQNDYVPYETFTATALWPKPSRTVTTASPVLTSA